MNELDKILVNMKTRPIEGHRPVSSKKQRRENREKRMRHAIRDTVKILSDGQWHSASVTKKIAKAYGVTWKSLCDECGIAESDSGKFVCIVTENTPEIAPDEEVIGE